MRIKHWIKNLLIFIPLIFDKALFQPNLFFSSFLTFLAFGLTASSIYIINDISDIEEDKKHPKKKHRPIASEKMSLTEAKILATILIILAAILGYSVNLTVLTTLFVYVVFNVLYSYKLKYIAIVDILSVSLMYIIRVYAGAFAVSTVVSNWLLLTTLFAALFVITAKRKSEFVNGRGKKTRYVLTNYDPRSLDHFLIIAGTSALLSYALYTFTQGKMFVWSIIFAVFAVFRYSLLIFHEEYDVEEPEIILVKDKALFLDLIIWGAFILTAFYLL